MPPKYLDKTQEDLVKMLGAAFFDIPAAKRPNHEALLEYVLKSANLDVTSHRYMLRDRFKEMLPGGAEALKRNRPKLAYSLYAYGDDPMYDSPFLSSYATVPEMAEFINRTTQMVYNHLRDTGKHIRGSAKAVWRNRGVSTIAGTVMFQLIPTELFSSDSVEEAIATRVPPREGAKQMPRSRAY